MRTSQHPACSRQSSQLPPETCQLCVLGTCCLLRSCIALYTGCTTGAHAWVPASPWLPDPHASVGRCQFVARADQAYQRSTCLNSPSRPSWDRTRHSSTRHGCFYCVRLSQWRFVWYRLLRTASCGCLLLPPSAGLLVMLVLGCCWAFPAFSVQHSSTRCSSTPKPS